jgi:hypothetical protein
MLDLLERFLGRGSEQPYMKSGGHPFSIISLTTHDQTLKQPNTFWMTPKAEGRILLM